MNFSSTPIQDAINLKDWSNVGALIWEKSVLYPDSFVEVNVTPNVAVPDVGELVISKDLGKLTNCSGGFFVPNKTRLVDSFLYNVPSGFNWWVKRNNLSVFNLSFFTMNANMTGNPSRMYLPGLMSGNNSARFMGGNETNVTTQCSDYARVLGKLAVRIASDQTQILPKAKGCIWKVAFDSGASPNMPSPLNYSGTDSCSYRAGSVYDINNSVQVATYNLLRGLDFDNDFDVDVDFSAIDVVFDAVSVAEAPYLWGPAIVEIKAWY